MTRLEGIKEVLAKIDGPHSKLLGDLAWAVGEIDRLQAVMDAADAFLAQPPEGMKEWLPFHQSTTAGDCRALCEAYRKASEAAETARDGKVSG